MLKFGIMASAEEIGQVIYIYKNNLIIAIRFRLQELPVWLSYRKKQLDQREIRYSKCLEFNLKSTWIL